MLVVGDPLDLVHTPTNPHWTVRSVTGYIISGHSLCDDDVE